MALMEAVVSLSMEAGSDLSADQWKFVKMASDGQIDVVASAGGRATGVLLNDPSAAGREAEVAISGRVKVLCGAGGLDEGATVSSTAAGLAVTSVTAGHQVLGECLKAAASGELAEILLRNGGII